MKLSEQHRICLGLLYSLSFTAMLVRFCVYASAQCSSDPIQHVCHKSFFGLVNLLLPVCNLYRMFFGLSPIDLGCGKPRRKS